MLEEEEEEEESDEPGLEYLQRELGSVCLLKDMWGRVQSTVHKHTPLPPPFT